MSEETKADLNHVVKTLKTNRQTKFDTPEESDDTES